MPGDEGVAPDRPLTLAFVSGKGGVGKTLLAVAFAKEISRSIPTLLVDLDFFNRGLTALLQHGEPVSTVERPRFDTPSGAGTTEDWTLVRVDENLFHLDYPDLTEAEMKAFATLETDRITGALREFIANVASACSCRCVIFDCHGGPDHTSLAACAVADHALLVSEPDRITFHGTLNFARQVHWAVGDEGVDLHLVFNKVVPAFSGLFLRRFYNRTIRPLFGDKPLLATFPLEVYLTKEFERTPFLTDAYPYSLLARKTRVALYDLLHSTRRDVLSYLARTMPAWMRAYRRVALGKSSFLIDAHFISAVIATAVVAWVVVAGIGEGVRQGVFSKSLAKPAEAAESFFEDYGFGVFLIGTVWLAAALFHYWTRGLGRRFTRASRMRRRPAMAGYAIGAALIWAFPITILLSLVGGILSGDLQESIGGIAVLGVLFVSISVEQAYKGFRELLYERHRVESLLRIAFAIGILVVPCILVVLFIIGNAIE